MSYKDYGFSTENATYAHGYIFKPMLRAIAKKGDRIILDLGCGNGWLVNYLIENGFNAYGTDASASGIQIAKQKNAGRFFLQDLSTDDLPVELKSIPFNTIISTEVIEHLYAPKEYLDFCKTVLLAHGGGELIITTPYHGYFKNLLIALSGSMDKHFAVLRDGGHIKFWSRKTLGDLLEDKGFTHIQFTGCGRLPYLWKSMMIHAKI